MELKRLTAVPGPKSIALMERRKRSVARGPFHTTPIFVAKAKGAVLTDVDGNEFVDFASGIGVTNAGHCESHIVDAVRRQAGELIHGSFNVTPYEGYVRLCEKLNAAVPGDFEKKSFLANSGAEAVENAIKIARVFTGRSKVACFEHAFHGRTFMAMALTYKEKPYKAGFQVHDEDVIRAPFPYVYRWKSSKGGVLNEESVSAECFEEFKKSLSAAGEKPAAVIIEPVLGEGGFVPAPKKYLQLLTEYCRKEGIVVIADEIQTGFGRTGDFFASKKLGFNADLFLSAKGLGGGMPVSAVTGRAEIMDAPLEGGIGGTFGGNPVACAAALAVFDLYEKHDLFKRADSVARQLSERFNAWKEKFPVVGDVRGLGPMQAIELVTDRNTKEAATDAAKKLVKYAYENGVVAMTSGSLGNVVRFLVPLVITDDELKYGLDVIERGLK